MNYYEIKFNGIKDGSHSNSFEIKDKFFDTFENSEIKQAEIIASTTLNKQEKATAHDPIFTEELHNMIVSIVIHLTPQPSLSGMVAHVVNLWVAFLVHRENITPCTRTPT